MVSFTSFITAATLFSSTVLAQSNQQFYIQNWGNGEDTTNYTFTSLAAGRYTLDWTLGPGGNFVAGKGYAGSQNLWVAVSDLTKAIS
jgi:endo-1,4-beta-xylanase